MVRFLFCRITWVRLDVLVLGDTHDSWQEVRESNFQSCLFYIFVAPLPLLVQAVNSSGEQ